MKRTHKINEVKNPLRDLVNAVKTISLAEETGMKTSLDNDQRKAVNYTKDLTIMELTYLYGYFLQAKVIKENQKSDRK